MRADILKRELIWINDFPRPTLPGLRIFGLTSDSYVAKRENQYASWKPSNCES